jgi:hypothetical protein
VFYQHLSARPGPNFPPVKNRVLGCRHADRDGVSLLGRAAFLHPGRRLRRRAQQPWPQATGKAGAERVDAGEHGGSLNDADV